MTAPDPPGRLVGPGEHTWSEYAADATDDDLRVAFEALEALEALEAAGRTPADVYPVTEIGPV